MSLLLVLLYSNINFQWGLPWRLDLKWHYLFSSLLNSSPKYLSSKYLPSHYWLSDIDDLSFYRGCQCFEGRKFLPLCQHFEGGVVFYYLLFLQCRILSAYSGSLTIKLAIFYEVLIFIIFFSYLEGEVSLSLSLFISGRFFRFPFDFLISVPVTSGTLTELSKCFLSIFPRSTGRTL